jgi:hypothetical protein
MDSNCWGDNLSWKKFILVGYLGTRESIVIQSYNSEGTPVGNNEETSIHAIGLNSISSASLLNNAFVVVWAGNNGVWMMMFDSNKQSQGSPTQVGLNVDAIFPKSATVATWPTEEFIVSRAATQQNYLFAAGVDWFQLYFSDGTPNGRSFEVWRNLFSDSLRDVSTTTFSNKSFAVSNTEIFVLISIPQ